MVINKLKFFNVVITDLCFKNKNYLDKIILFHSGSNINILNEINKYMNAIDCSNRLSLSISIKIYIK